MTPQEIRDAVAASPELQALLPDTQAIANALSASHHVFTPTEVGTGTILEVLGITAGNALLDVIYTAPDFRYVKPLVEQGRLRLDSPLVVATMQSLVGTVLTQAQADALKARAKVPDSISEYDVRVAIYNDDGTLRI